MHQYFRSTILKNAIAFSSLSILGLTAVHCEDSSNATQTNRRELVNQLAEKLQHRFVNKLQDLETTNPNDTKFSPISWLRDNGTHGGGTRYQSSPNSSIFTQATVNVSSVHFQDLEKYPIDSATALSVIVHPKNPKAPSMHFHISFMEPRQGKPYWRMIADLNPSIPNLKDEQLFSTAIENVKHITPKLYIDSKIFGDKYFYIPSLGRHRGIYHFFIGKLEEDEVNFEDGCELALELAETAIVTYTNILENVLTSKSSAAAVAAAASSASSPFSSTLSTSSTSTTTSTSSIMSPSPPFNTITADEQEQQLAYHTLYLYQVLTLDRGTTHGLMAHDQNDIGTLGSLPPAINCELLRHWIQRTPSPQNQLLDTVLEIIPGNGVITDETRGKLAKLVRKHYRSNKEARLQQADLDLKWWAEKSQLRVKSQIRR